MDCPLCTTVGKNILFESDLLYVVAVEDDAKAPAFCRVIWKKHIQEMTDLTANEQQYLMSCVFKVEAAMRQVLHPTKMNLASFGNQVPHLHWHVIARFQTDSCFPDPIWAPEKRAMPALNLPAKWHEQVAKLLGESIKAI
ncbi:HIT family protein [Neisseria sp. Ec49-e6-T10]|uniref:HIT family protein n=1 Tax=Neisseria sp. Ec49-e6-T10 TaxID=3140744 RepID=UPI003EBD7482